MAKGKMSTFGKKSEYKSNLTESLRSIGMKYVETNMPTVGNTIASMQSVTNTFRVGTILNKNRIKTSLRAHTTAMKTYIGTTFNNIKKDISTGKLFNSEREFEGDTDTNYLMNNYLDDEGSGGEVFGAAASNDVIGAGFRDTGAVLTGSTEYLSDTMNTLSVQSTLNANRNHLEQLYALQRSNDLAQASLNFQLNEMNGYMNRAMNFFDRMEEEAGSIREEISKMAKANEERYSGNGSSNIRSSALERIFDESGFNIGEYLREVKKNKDNSTGILSMFMGAAGDFKNNVKNNPIGTLLPLLMNLGTSKASKGAMKNFNSSMNAAFGTYLMGMNKWRRSDNPIFRAIGNILGIDMNKATRANTASYKNEKLTLEVENKKNKAITEVIPQYLSAITKQLTGIDKMFDYDKGIFVDRSKRSKELTNEDRSAILQTMSDSKRYMSNNLYKIEGNMRANERVLYQEDLDSFIYFLATLGENVTDKMSYDYAVKRGLSLRGGKKSFTMMMALYKSLNKSQLANVRAEQAAAVNQIRDYRQRQDMNLNFSGGMMAFNQFYDPNMNPGGSAPSYTSKAGRSAAGTEGSSKAGRKMRAKRTFDSKPFTEEDLREMSPEEILSAINESTLGERPVEKKPEEDPTAKYRKKFKDKLSRFFNIKNHTILNSLFGDDGFFPGILNSTADTISDILYGDREGKDKGIFGTLFTDLKDQANKLTADLRTVIKGKVGESTFYKKLFGDKKEGTKGFFGDIADSIKDKLSSLFDPLKKKLGSFYDKYLKEKFDKVHEKAEGYRAKAGKYARDAADDFIGASESAFKVQPKPKPKPKKYKIAKTTSAEEFAQAAKAQAARSSSDIKKKIFGQMNGTTPLDAHADGGITDGSISIVGERGPEVALLPSGTNVVPNEQAINVNISGFTGDGSALMSSMTGMLIAANGATADEEDNSPKGLVKRGIAARFRKKKLEEPVGDKEPKTEADEKKGFFSSLWDKINGIAQNSNVGSVAGGAFISSAMGLGPLPGMLIGALTGNKKRLKAEKAKMEKEAADQGKEFDKAAWETKKAELKSAFSGSSKGALVGAVASSLLGLGPLPGVIVGSLVGRKKKQDKIKAEQDGKAVEDAQNDNEKQSFLSKFKGATIGGIASSMLGLGPLPGIVIGTLISNRKKAKAEKKKAEQEGKAVEDAQKETTKQGFFSKFKGAAIGGVASTMLGLGPIPGIVIGSLISKKKSKKDLKEAEKAGESVDNETNKNKGIRGFFKKFKGATVGALASTLLGLGPIPGAIIGTLIAKKKMTKAEENEAKKTGEAVDSESSGKKPGLFARLFGRKKKDDNTATSEGETSGENGDASDTSIPTKGGMRLGAKISAARGAAKAKLKELSENRKKAAEARRTQADTKRLMTSVKKGDQEASTKLINNGLQKADTAGELAGIEQATNIAANADTIGEASGIAGAIGEATEGGGSNAGGILGATGALLGGAGILEVFGKLLMSNVKKSAKNFVKNNIGDAYSAGQVVVGAKNIKEGISLAANGDTIDEANGSGQAARGTGQVAAGGFKLAGTVAKAATSSTKSTSILGKMVQWIKKLITGIGEKVAGDIGQAGVKAMTGAAGTIASQVTSKGAASITAKAFTFLAKYGQAIGWAITIAQAVWDFGSGMNDVANIMGTGAGYDPPTSLRIVCGLSKALSGFLLGIIPVKWLAGIIYGIIGKKEDQAALQEAKEAQKSEYDAFIKEHPEAVEKGLTQEKYNDITNKTTWTNVKEGFLGIFGKKESNLDDYTEKVYTNNEITIINTDSGGSEARGNSNKLKIKDVLAKISANLSDAAKKNSSNRNLIVNEDGRGYDEGRGFFSNIVKTVKSWFAGDTSKVDKSDMSSDFKVSNIPYYSQNDDRWKDIRYGNYNNMPDTIGAGGCGPTVAAMMFEGLTGRVQSPVEMAKLADKKGYKHNGTSTKFFDYLGEENGIAMSIENGLSTSAIAALNDKIPVALIGKNKEGAAPYGPGNHYVLGTEANDRGVTIFDPLDPANNKRYTYDYLSKDTHTSIIPQVSVGNEDEGSGARGSVTVPTAIAKRALNQKNLNKTNSKISNAKEVIEYSRGRGDEDDSKAVKSIANIAQAMLDVLTSMAETLTNIEANNISANGGNVTTNAGGSNKSNTTTYSAKESSTTKSSMYAKAVTA